MRRELLTLILRENDRGQSVSVVTDLSSGRQGVIGANGSDDAGILPASVRIAVAAAVAAQSSITIEGGLTSFFVDTYLPRLRLLLVGAVHIAQALAPIATMAGYTVTIIDPRGAFAAPERFSDCRLSTDWPDEAIPALEPDRRTAIVTLTHDPKIDDVALLAALATQAFYVGALGSRRTHAARLARMAQIGVEGHLLARIRGPVGLNIGATTPAEIAISILAEMTATLRTDKIRTSWSKDPV